MMSLCSEVLRKLQGKTLSTAESCTGGGIGHCLTAVSGSSAVYKGGVISYCNEVKMQVLHVDPSVLHESGPVCAAVAEAMAGGVRELLHTDVSVSVTGLAGPGGDEYGNPQGRVFIGYSDEKTTVSKKFTFAGDREAVRNAAIREALLLILDHL